MRISIVILGALGLLMLFVTYTGDVVSGAIKTGSATNVAFTLGYMLCCIVWMIGIFYANQSHEDAGLFEEMTESIFIIDRSARTILCVNQATTDLLGFRRDDLIHRSASQLFAGNETVVDKLLEVKSHQDCDSSTQTFSAMRKDGSLVDMQFTVRPVRYHGAGCVLVSGRDMSARLKVMEDQSRLAAILESSVSGLCACNNEGIIVNWNRAAALILGYRSKDVIGKPFMMLMQEENHKERWKSFQTLMAGKAVPPYEGEAVHKSGKKVYVHMDVSPIRNAEGQVVGVSALFRDIGKEKEKERLLREKEERLRIAFKTAKLGLWDYDCTNDAMQILSDAGNVFLEYDLTDKQWTCGRVASLIHPKERQQSELEFQRILSSRSDFPLNFTARFQTQNGVYRWIHVTGQVIERNEEGLPVRVIGVNRDVSQEVRDRQREESERLRTKTLLAWSERTKASRKDILDFTLQKSVELTDSPLGLIGEVDREKDQLKVSWLIQGVWPNRTGQLAGHETTAERFAIGGSPLWTKAILTGEPMTANSPALDAKDRNFFGVHNPIEKYLTVPILEEGRIAGVVMVANKEEDYASHDVIELQLLAQGMWSHMRKIDLENARTKVEREHKIILENLQEGVLCFNQDRRVAYANRFACEMLKRTPEEFLGQACDEADSGKDEGDVLRVAQETFRTERTCHREIVSPDGYRYDVTARPVCDEDGKLFRVVETFFVLSTENLPVSLPEVTTDPIDIPNGNMSLG